MDRIIKTVKNSIKASLILDLTKQAQQGARHKNIDAITAAFCNIDTALDIAKTMNDPAAVEVVLDVHKGITQLLQNEILKEDNDG